jgi:hypothetical protein
VQLSNDAQNEEKKAAFAEQKKTLDAILLRVSGQKDPDTCGESPLLAGGFAFEWFRRTHRY